MIRLSAGPYGISYGSRQVGHATKIRAPGPHKQKHDRRDVELILKLPVENRFPAIWMPYEEQLRSVDPCYHIGHHWVRLRTQIQMTCRPLPWLTDCPEVLCC